MKNVDEEVRDAEEQKEDLRYAERMARLDELTGVKNQKAFTEETRIINVKIKCVCRNTDRQ